MSAPKRTCHYCDGPLDGERDCCLDPKCLGSLYGAQGMFAMVDGLVKGIGETVKLLEEALAMAMEVTGDPTGHLRQVKEILA